MLTCFSKQYFGVECPGCGIQRSAIKLLQGDVLDSLALYPALIPFALLLIISPLSLIKFFKIDVKWVVILAVANIVIMFGHYILKIAGWAPWYDQAAAGFHP